jgi:NNP family nitrate/nitrite transporter-like MFS transporter
MSLEKAILMLNVAITIPARILVGVLVDKFGPRKSYSFLLAFCGALCLLFAAAQSFEWLAVMRFLLGFVGAGFVIGIRLVSEWFPAREVGIAEGVYGGWGNFGAAVASMSMPLLALAFGGDDGWRYAIASTGLIALIYSVIFYRNVRDTPEGSTYFKPQKMGGLEVTSKGDFIFYALMNVPLYLALALLTWRLSPEGLKLLSAEGALIAYVVIAALALYQWTKIWHVNKHLFTGEHPAAPSYKFKQVAILNLAYMACFGSELAVVSMLPLFFIDTFHVSPVYAGMTAGCFAVMNLFARPSGGAEGCRGNRLRGLAIGKVVDLLIDIKFDKIGHLVDLGLDLQEEGYALSSESLLCTDSLDVCHSRKWNGFSYLDASFLVV